MDQTPEGPTRHYRGALWSVRGAIPTAVLFCKAPHLTDELATLQSLGFELPSPAYIVGAIVFGLLGWAAWRRGRKVGPRTTMGLGFALRVYP